MPLFMPEVTSGRLLKAGLAVGAAANTRCHWAFWQVKASGEGQSGRVQGGTVPPAVPVPNVYVGGTWPYF